MSKRFSILATALTLLTFTSLMGADGDGGCGSPPVLDNNGFDLWCGAQLCYWDVEAGRVSRVPTWHGSDFGAEFVGDIAAISQYSDLNGTIDCFKFRAVANIDLGVNVTVEVDYFDDGTVEVSERIPNAEWRPIEFLLPAPRTYEGARFRIRKEGAGQAILAELQVERSDVKCIDPAPEINDRANGQVCGSNDQCEGGLCFPTDFGVLACSECGNGVACDGAEVCGLETPASVFDHIYSACGPAGRHTLGERCRDATECASGVCFQSRCAACEPSGPCGTECVQAPTPGVGPFMCAPAQGTYLSGETCLADADCESNLCVGEELRVCDFDNRLCDTSDDCPGDTTCVILGVADGTCG